MATIEQREAELADRLGPRWAGPLVLKASTAKSKLGQVRRAYFANGVLEEVICVAPGNTEAGPETWLIDTREPAVDEPPPAPVIDRTDLVKAMDVSSHQDRDLSALIAEHGIEHVVVHLYTTAESPPQQYSLDQIASASAAGCSVGGYVWLFGGISVEQQVGDALELAARAGLTLPVLWLDAETYEDKEGIKTWPSALETLAACEYGERQGQPMGVYTGNWLVRDYWKGRGIGELGWRWAWLADFNDTPDLEIYSPYWPEEKVVGHQYEGSPVDLSVFARAVTVRG